MISLRNLNRQHIAINEEVDILETELKKSKAYMDITEITYHIGKLTALLKIHLLEEDRFLYPELLKYENKEIKNLTDHYIHEMRNFVDEYTIFKCSYKIGNRMNDKIDDFMKDALIVVRTLKERLIREESELYALVSINKI